MPNVDFSKVEIPEFGAVPKGQYKVVVDRPPEMKVSSNGNDTAFWLLRVTDVVKVRSEDIPAAGISALVGRTIPHNTSFSEKSLWNLKRTLLSFGADPEELDTELDINEEFLAEFEGREAVVTVTTRTYEGQETNQVQNMRALTQEEASVLA